MKSVNALNGLTSFLPNQKRRSMDEIFGVNALNGLTSFLPSNVGRSYSYHYSCVNALNGLTSFLRFNPALKKALTAVCQRPKRAYFISTEGGVKSL